MNFRTTGLVALFLYTSRVHVESRDLQQAPEPEPTCAGQVANGMFH